MSRHRERRFRRITAMVSAGVVVAVALVGAVPGGASAASPPSYAITSTTTVGGNPEGVAVDSTRHEVFVDDALHSAMSVVDETTHAVIASIPLGGQQQAIAVDPPTHQVFVSVWIGDDTADVVAVVDERSNTLTTTIAVGYVPAGIAVDSGRHRAYVATREGPAVVAIDTSTDTVIDTIGLSLQTFVSTVLIDPVLGRLYLYDDNGPRPLIYVFDEDTETQVGIVANSCLRESFACALAVDPVSHKLFVTSSGQSGSEAPHWGSISVVDEATLRVVATRTISNYLSAAASDPVAHTLYVTGGNDGEGGATVYVWDEDTLTLIATVPLAGPGAFPASIDVDTATHNAEIGDAPGGLTSTSPGRLLTLSRIGPPLTAPSAPLTPVATAGDTTATVRFSPPVDDGGVPVSSYTVTATDMTSAARGGQQASGTLQPIVVTRLTDGDRYTFSVVASSTVGTGAASAASAAVTPAAPAHPQLFTAVDPTRILVDSSAPPSTVRCVQVAGTAGLPINATVAVLNVTTVLPADPGNVEVYPDTAGTGATPTPNASTVAFNPGHDVANTAVVQLPADGKVCYATQSDGDAGVLIDVTGYATQGSGVVTQSPTRILDTRAGGTGAIRTPLIPGQRYPVQISGTGGVPAGAIAVLLNVTVTGDPGHGNLAAYPDGPGRPTTSSVNYLPGQTAANAAIVSLPASGKIDLLSSTTSSAAANPVNVVLDVTGYVLKPSAYVPLSPVRVLDTRATSAVGALRGPLAADHPYSVALAGTHGLPASATAALLNVTAIGPTTAGNLSVYGDTAGTSLPPGSSSVNYIPGQATPNLVLVPLAPDGKVNFYSDQPASARVNIAADLVGYTMPAP